MLEEDAFRSSNLTNMAAGYKAFADELPSRTTSRIPAVAAASLVTLFALMYTYILWRNRKQK